MPSVSSNVASNREHGMLLVDQALAGEEVELADPHRQHRQVAALHLGAAATIR